MAPSVPAPGQLERFRPYGRDQHGNVHGHVVRGLSAVETSVEAHLPLPQHGADDLHVLGQVAQRTLEREPVGPLDRRLVARPQPEPEAARSELGHGLAVLHEGQRVARPGQHNGRTQLYGLGAHGRRRKDARGIPADVVVRGPGPARGEPDRLNPQGLCLANVVQHFLDISSGNLDADYSLIHYDLTDIIRVIRVVIPAKAGIQVG